eukprot:3136726-Ditylum_brightwellii.AAC.1
MRDIKHFEFWEESEDTREEAQPIPMQFCNACESVCLPAREDFMRSSHVLGGISRQFDQLWEGLDMLFPISLLPHESTQEKR